MHWHTLTGGGLLLLACLASCVALPPRQVSQIGASSIAWVRKGSSGPVVVFQSGLGDGLSPWASVIARLPPTVSAFAYDRPGYGASVPAPTGARDACTIARELRELLKSAGLKPPYLLVGHSLGGLYQYVFARLYREDVAGLLLLDPTHPDHWTAMQMRAPEVAAVITGLRATAFSAAMQAEFDGQAKCLRGLWKSAPPAPISILMRTRYDVMEPPAFRELTRDLDRDWLSLVPGATSRAVQGAGHYIQRDRPDVVVAAILALLHASEPVASGARASASLSGHRALSASSLRGVYPGRLTEHSAGSTCRRRQR